ncbi:protein eva-1 homolog B [Echinops telfairi]|uniref:Protein eva-1 homolog B n=1 Tax=Echinops telfairi TaxID=9371 RepID=A0ABM0ZQZ6_ECHTE|nr:protein eva-1 homolog B [Echinops telfairi]
MFPRVRSAVPNSELYSSWHCYQDAKGFPSFLPLKLDCRLNFLSSEARGGPALALHASAVQTHEGSRQEGLPLTPGPARGAQDAANPESFGLYFVLGVCFGLLLTLCLLVISISCAPRPRRPRGPPPHRDPRSSTLEAEDEDEDDEEDTVTRLGPDDTLPGAELSQEPDGPLSVNVFTSAEELERAQRLEERERILREIWRTGQPDLLGTGTLGPGPAATGTLGRMHYY